MLAFCGWRPILFFGFLNWTVSALNVTFLACMSYTSLAYSYDYYGPAIDMALIDLRQQYPEIAFNKVNLSPRDVQSCPDLDGRILDMVIDYLYSDPEGAAQWKDPTNLVVIIANGCSDSLRYVGDFARELNIPVISSGGSGSVLQNRQRFPTMFRLVPYQQSDLVQTLLLFLRKFQWTDIALLCDTNPGLGNFFALACGGFEDGLLRIAGASVTPYRFNTQVDTNYNRYLLTAVKRSRVVLIVAHGNKTRDIMIVASRLGLTNGDYVFITTYPLEHPLYGTYKWQFQDENDNIAQEAFQSLYFVSTRPIRGPKYVPFEVELKYRAYVNYDFLYGSDERVSAFTALQHTVVRFTGQIIVETLQQTGEFQDGAFIMSKAFERRNVSSVTGDFQLANGDRVLYTYVIVGMEHHKYTFTEYYEYDTVVQKLLPVGNNTIEWAHRNSPPPNTPFCGFDGSNPQCSSSKQIIIGVLVGVTLAVLVLGKAGYHIAKFTKTDESDLRWYVSMDDVEMSNTEVPTASQGSITTSGFSHGRGSQTKSQSSMGRSSTRTNNTSVASIMKSANIAQYKGKAVWVHTIKLGHKFSPTAAQVSLIKKMKRVNNINFSHFYGMAPHELDMNILSEINARGSLFDVMNNETIKFDTALKHSVVNDLTNGMVFLHDSQIGYHGDLSCKTCFMDNRFVLKIAYFRLDFLPRVMPDFVEGDAAYYRFLTFPPEQLRGPVTRIFNGSKEGDVYSYGHVVAQVCTELEPYEKDLQEYNFTPKEILDRIIMQSIIPCRPKIPNVEACPATLAVLIEKCWDDRPTSRPTFRAVEKLLKDVPGFKTEKNFVDSLFQRMAAYAEELEARITTATAGMMDEKKKSEELLFQVLPRHLALALSQGQKIEPELFESVTIGFTALANFGEIAAESSPLQIVDLLNDLYSMFDATLELFDVYKVETISDSYMIASGIPVRNGEEHSRQIAKMSLQLMKESASFKIRHRPKDTLQIKIGFHQGKCAAGIVGMKMPRYCLFGDTINTASRMTSFGLPLRIQISATAMKHLQQFNEFRFQFRGLIEIKGKGQQRCYWLLQDHEKLEETNESGTDPVLESTTTLTT